MRMKTSWMGLAHLWKRRQRTPWLLPPCEDTEGKTQMAVNQKLSPHQALNLLAPWSWTREINICCLSHLIYGIYRYTYGIDISMVCYSSLNGLRQGWNNLCGSSYYCSKCFPLCIPALLSLGKAIRLAQHRMEEPVSGPPSPSATETCSVPIEAVLSAWF